MRAAEVEPEVLVAAVVGAAVPAGAVERAAAGEPEEGAGRLAAVEGLGRPAARLGVAAGLAAEAVAGLA